MNICIMSTRSMTFLRFSKRSVVSKSTQDVLCARCLSPSVVHFTSPSPLPAIGLISLHEGDAVGPILVAVVLPLPPRLVDFLSVLRDGAPPSCPPSCQRQVLPSLSMHLPWCAEVLSLCLFHPQELALLEGRQSCSFLSKPSEENLRGIC